MKLQAAWSLRSHRSVAFPAVAIASRNSSRRRLPQPKAGISVLWLLCRDMYKSFIRSLCGGLCPAWHCAECIKRTKVMYKDRNMNKAQTR